MNVKIIRGSNFQDHRGLIRFNNDFDASPIKRIYFISNSTEEPIRGLQGHQIESRWLLANKGVFNVFVIEIDDWENPNKNCVAQCFKLSSEEFDVLHIPPGYITKIESFSSDSILSAMSDYAIGEVMDEYRFDKNYFNC
jgi:hypothetical protein